MRRTPFCEPFSLTTLSSLVILVTLLGNDVSCVGRQHEGAKQKKKGLGHKDSSWTACDFLCSQLKVSSPSFVCS